MDSNFKKKIEDLLKNQQFESIKFELDLLDEKEKEDPYFQNILGIVSANNKNYTDARKHFYSSLKLDQNYIHSLINLSKLSYTDKDFQETIRLLKNYHLKNPDNTKIISILADITLTAGFIDETLFFHKKLIQSGKFEIKDLSALITLLNYSNNYSDDEYKNYCKLYEKILSKNKTSYYLVDKEHDKKRIAFLSYDFRDHSVGYFLKDFIKELKKNKFVTIGFNLYRKNFESELKTELKDSFQEWYDVSEFDDKKLSDFIYSKKVGFLIDLAGYSDGNRIQVFKNKPAPIQISWLGYCNETHIKEIDYMITDENISKDNRNNKNLIKMPRIWNSFSKLEDLDINDLPFIKNKIFNFGCFNNFLKISDETIDVWGEILNKFTNSNIILKSSISMDKDFKKYIFKKFKHKVEEERVKILNYEVEKKNHLKQYLNIDLCLDTFPYNGVTTTFESLWMGVPVITLKGERFVSRCGYSINKNANLNNFIAENKQHYISIALQFMKDENIDKLISLRKSLRLKVLKSPLFDTSDFVNNFTKKLNKIIKQPNEV